jgi:hypothetical protein
MIYVYSYINIWCIQILHETHLRASIASLEDKEGAVLVSLGHVSHVAVDGHSWLSIDYPIHSPNSNKHQQT